MKYAQDSNICKNVRRHRHFHVTGRIREKPRRTMDSTPPVKQINGDVMSAIGQRTFLCLALSSRNQAALASISNRIRTDGYDVSLSNPQDAHLTLVFLGSTPAGIIDLLIPGMDEVCSTFRPFTLSIGGGGYFGSPRSPKVVWVGVKPDSVLMDMQRALALMVSEAGMALESRPFHPHLTVARIRNSLPPGALTSMITCINNTNFAESPVDRVLFMNSLLNGSGPRYTIIHQTILKGQ